MKVWIHILVCVTSFLAVTCQTCPFEHFSAVFTISVDQTIDDLASVTMNDPELAFFKTYMKFKDSDIQHTIDDAIQFFNNTYGLDFSDSPPNEKNERFFQNSKMSPVILPDFIDLMLTDNHWIQTGKTRSSCYRIRDGGFRVTFSAEQTLHGSYGGAMGKPVGITNFVGYGFYIIDVCEQSPVIIQFQSSSPVRAEPVDGTSVFISDLYNHVLGYGKVHGIVQISHVSGKFRAVSRAVFTFPAQ